jgi:hypothetical protein
MSTVSEDVLGTTVAHHFVRQESGDLLRSPVPVQDFAAWVGDVCPERQQVHKLTEYFRVVEDRHQ